MRSPASSKAALHPYLRERLCGRIAVGVGASAAEVLAAAEAVEAQVERAREAAIVGRLKEAAATGRRGILGLAPALKALSEHRVERLVVSKGYAEQGWRVPGTGAWPSSVPATPTPATPMERVEDVVEDAIEEAISQGVPGDDLRRRRRPRRDGPHRRPAPLLTDPLRSVGLDVGGTKVLGVVIDPDEPGTVLAEDRVPTPDGGAGLVDVLLDLALSARPRRRGDRRRACRGSSTGMARCTWDPTSGRMQDVPIARLLSERSGVLAVVDNDANCHAEAEHAAGAAVGVDEVLVVTLGTGIGAGIITSGRLLHGAHGFAGEPGHMVVDPNGPPCPCGKRGCWERFASGSGLGRLARDAASGGRLDAAVALAGGDPEAVRGEHVTASARAGDAESQAVLDELARWIALGLANLVNVLDPAVIVIGGGLVEAADLLLPQVRHRFADLVMAGDQRPPVPIVPAQLGDRAGAIGAALLAAGSR